MHAPTSRTWTAISRHTHAKTHCTAQSTLRGLGPHGRAPEIAVAHGIARVAILGVGGEGIGGPAVPGAGGGEGSIELGREESLKNHAVGWVGWSESGEVSTVVVAVLVVLVDGLCGEQTPHRPVWLSSTTATIIRVR
jgi:hypothetical protein